MLRSVQVGTPGPMEIGSAIEIRRLNIPQIEPWFGEEEAAAVATYMRSGGWVTEFNKTREFEEAIAGFTGAKHCIVTNNGTVSLTLAALAAGIKSGDEVIVPNYSMIATPNAVGIFGAAPVFVDVEPSTLCLDLPKTRAAITPRTRAIILVAPNGRFPSVGIEPYVELARKKGLILIEDAAQGLGSRFPDGRHVGTRGLAGTFSFSMPKIISTGQGGAIITNDDDVARRIRKLKDFGRSADGTDVHDSIGFNFKFTDIQAVIGIEQMKKLALRVARKKVIWQTYSDGLEGIRGIRLFDHDLSCTVPWFIDTLCEGRAELQAHLSRHGIATRVMYPPLNLQLAYRRPGNHPVSEAVGRSGLWLPSSTQLTNAQISAAIRSIREFYR